MVCGIWVGCTSSQLWRFCAQWRGLTPSLETKQPILKSTTGIKCQKWRNEAGCRSIMSTRVLWCATHAPVSDLKHRFPRFQHIHKRQGSEFWSIRVSVGRSTLPRDKRPALSMFRCMVKSQAWQRWSPDNHGKSYKNIPRMTCFKMAAAEILVFWGSGKFYYIFIKERPCKVPVIVGCVVVIYQLSGKI